jgi:hypothetical protein
LGCSSKGVLVYFDSEDAASAAAIKKVFFVDNALLGSDEVGNGEHCCGRTFFAEAQFPIKTLITFSDWQRLCVKLIHND